jgi:ubiquinol-cytochrome c reductase cytochrome c subunit
LTFAVWSHGSPVTFDDSADSPSAQGRALFETSCAPCHGASGAGVYLDPSIHPSPIAGADVAKVIQEVRLGSKGMPAFSSAVLPDASLRDLAGYVHETLAHPPGEHAHVGPRDLDPLVVGLIAWCALAVLACGLAFLFAEGRN